MEKIQLEKYGESLIGKTAQSRIVKTLSTCGQKSIIAPSVKIISYEIVTEFTEPSLMVTLETGETVFEDTIFNIK